MSQEQPQPPEKPPQAPPVKPVQRQPQQLLRQANQTLGQIWARVQPVLKAGSIQGLRLTIRLLSGALAKLETPSTASATAPGTVTSIPAEPEIVKDPNSSHPATAQPATVLPVVEPSSQASETASFQSQLWTGWTAILSQIRSRFPTILNQISDPILTGVLVGTFLVLFWVTAILPDKFVKTAQGRADQGVPPAPLSAPAELAAPQASKPVTGTPQEPVVFPPPAPELTPEQKLLAHIQQQVAETTEQYAAGILQSIAADFSTKHLTVRLDAGWYNLDQAQQDKLASEIFRQAQELEFSQLEVTDLQDIVLARSPVVGSGMVVLKRLNSVVAPTY